MTEFFTDEFLNAQFSGSQANAELSDTVPVVEQDKIARAGDVRDFVVDSIKSASDLIAELKSSSGANTSTTPGQPPIVISDQDPAIFGPSLFSTRNVLLAGAGVLLIGLLTFLRR